MSAVTAPVIPSAPVMVDGDAPLAYTHDEFEALAAAHADLRMELTAQGELLIMPPTGGGSSRRNIKITTQLEIWSERDGSGIALESNCCYRLPDGAEYAPDASWVEMSRWEALGPDQQEKFPPLCPDFVVELLSPTDRLSKTQQKMREYIENGARLGWLIDPRTRRVEIYRPSRDVEVLDDPSWVSGEDVLLGFNLDLTKIWR